MPDINEVETEDGQMILAGKPRSEMIDPSVAVEDQPQDALPVKKTKGSTAELVDRELAIAEVVVEEEEEPSANVLPGPVMVIASAGGKNWEYQCRPVLPATITGRMAQIQSETARALPTIQTFTNSDGELDVEAILDAGEEDALIAMSASQADVVEWAGQLLIPPHRKVFLRRCNGDCPDDQIHDAGSVYEALQQAVKDYGQSSPKRSRSSRGRSGSGRSSR